MPSASELATVVLQPPPIQVRRVASCNRPAPDGGIPHTVLEEVDATDLAEFRDYLKRIPFAFGDFFPSMSGRAISSEGEVRLFLETAIPEICFPVACAMVEPTGRGWDLGLRSEKSTLEGNLPDMTVQQVFPPQTAASGGQYSQNTDLMAVEFKGPGVLNPLRRGNVPKSSDWDALSAQLMKYARVDGFTNVLCCDSDIAIFLHFTDTSDQSAKVKYLICRIDGQPLEDPNAQKVTLRELFLFGIWKGLSELNDLR